MQKHVTRLECIPESRHFNHYRNARTQAHTHTLTHTYTLTLARTQVPQVLVAFNPQMLFVKQLPGTPKCREAGVLAHSCAFMLIVAAVKYAATLPCKTSKIR